MCDFTFPSKDCNGCNKLISSPNCIFGGKCILYNNNAYSTKTTISSGNSQISVEIDEFDFSDPNNCTCKKLMYPEFCKETNKECLQYKEEDK